MGGNCCGINELEIFLLAVSAASPTAGSQLTPSSLPTWPPKSAKDEEVVFVVEEDVEENEEGRGSGPVSLTDDA